MWLPLVLCAAGLTPAPGLASQSPAERTSLEEYLRVARQARADLHRRLETRAEAYLLELGRVPAGAGNSALEAALTGLVELGVDATPLLVPHLEVAGDDARTAGDPALSKRQLQIAERRADRVAEALYRMPCDPIRGELLELAEQGSPRERTRALRVLENSAEPAQVRPRLLALYEAAQGQQAQTLLRTLIAIGGEGQGTFLVEQLDSNAAPLVDLALRALAASGDEAAAGRVAALLADPDAAPEHGEALLEYYLAQPDLVRSEQLLQFVRLATGTAPQATRLAVLAALPAFDPPLNYELRHGLEPLIDGRDKELREAALVALATLGDRSSKKDLLAPYDEIVDRNERWFRGYSGRAKILLRIGENDDAIKDFRRALEFGKDSASLQPESYIGLARAFARKGRLKDAAEWLRKAPISLGELQELEADVDFVDLRASRWGEEAFGR